MRGKPILDVEVANVSGHGFWLLIDDRERFLSFTDFPWFRDASIATLCNVQRPHPGHLYWPDLDVDLATESIDHPERFPLVSRVAASGEVRPKKQLRSAREKRPRPGTRRRA